MKKLVTCLLASVSIGAVAQTPKWNITEVTSVVGYIYNTYAVGTQIGAKTEKVTAGLRLACSVKSPEEPALILFWNGQMIASPTQTVMVSIDGKPLSTNTWFQEDHILHRSATKAKNIIDAMKIAHTVEFAWTGNDTVRYKVIFDVLGFNTKLDEFNASCKTQL